MSDSGKAVFLSYASQDADAARKIAEALRGAQIEVWFDQSELVGGDAWDQKIRRQIQDCALFVPVISANTEERHEGYFRLEWDLAEQRTHLMARGVPFLLPVVIDQTNEARAVVPDRFREVQWFKLPAGAPTPDFVARVQRLISQPRRAQVGAEPRVPVAATHPTAAVGAAHYDSLPPRSMRRRPLWAWVGAFAGAVALGFILLKSRPESTTANAKPVPSDNESSTTQNPRPTPPATNSKSIAVLPFENLSDDRENEYFSDGISEELLNVLSKIPDLKVSARTSAFSFKGKGIAIPEIARQLGVAHVVEGSVRKAGNRVRITAQLIKAADGFRVWSDNFERELKDIFAVQDEIAGRIAQVLAVRLQAGDPQAPIRNLEAYSLYLKARATLAQRGAENVTLARQHFELALALDPEFVPARAGLARALSVVQFFSELDGDKRREFAVAAEREARRVVAVQPGNAEAWSALGEIDSTYFWRWSEAAAAIERALVLAPNDSEVANFAGDYFRVTGDRARMLAMEGRAVELNPLHAINHADLANACLRLADYEGALRHARDGMALDPTLSNPYGSQVWALGNLRRFGEMRAVLVAARQRALAPESYHLRWEAWAAYFENRRDDGLRLLAQLAQSAERGEFSPAFVGHGYLLFGSSEEALRWLQRAYDTRDYGLVFGIEDQFTRIAADPKARVLLEKPELRELMEIRTRNAANPGTKR